MSKELERRPQIIAATRAAGYKITPAQLARWTAFGLLARSRQVGRGQGRGSARLYAAGTAKRVLAICAIREKHRPLPEIAWELWMHGEEIPERLVRSYLRGAVGFHDRVLAKAREVGFGGPDVTREAVELADKIAGSRVVPHDLRVRAGGTERVGTLVRAMMQVMLGTYDADAAAVIEPEDDDGVIVERVIGLEDARSDSVLDLQPWLQGQPAEGLEQASNLLGGDWLPALEAATFDDLRIARGEWNDMRELVGSAGEAFGEIFGTNLAGIPGMARGLDAMSCQDTALGIVMMLRMRSAADAKVDAALAQLHDVATSWRDQAMPAFRAMRILRDENLDFQNALAPVRMREVIKTKASFGAHMEALRPLGEQNEAAVSDALKRAGYDMSLIRPPDEGP